MGYVNSEKVGDYVCGKCKCNYVVPKSKAMISMFNTMKSCYRKVV